MASLVASKYVPIAVHASTDTQLRPPTQVSLAVALAGRLIGTAGCQTPLISDVAIGIHVPPVTTYSPTATQYRVEVPALANQEIEPTKLLLTVIEASQVLAISRSKLYELLNSGHLPSVHIGRSRRIRMKDVEDFVNGNDFEH